ncbi:hypothetical protein GWK47_019117 [Chionoecetes opilio]|uniref:Uncharacterized protein n=1 Tax=Chionoecetes opilio TaxID=41210 RepID=A0A8J4XQF4_CHIOP|nr:hypothetical protein GWK47_019117 [Chionoecetes opilio]
MELSCLADLPRKQSRLNLLYLVVLPGSKPGRPLKAWTCAGIALSISIMGGKKDLTKDQIKVIVSLHKAERPFEEIARIVDVTRRCVQKWVESFTVGWRRGDSRDTVTV